MRGSQLVSTNRRGGRNVFTVITDGSVVSNEPDEDEVMKESKKVKQLDQPWGNFVSNLFYWAVDRKIKSKREENFE